MTETLKLLQRGVNPAFILPVRLLIKNFVFFSKNKLSRKVYPMSPRVQTLHQCASATGGAFGFSEEDYASAYRAPRQPLVRVMAFLLVIAAGGYAVAQKLGLPGVVAQIAGGNRVV